MNQIINMMIRMFLRRGLNFGINKAVDYMAKKKETPENTNESEKPQLNENGTAKNAKRSIQMIRRLGRF